MAEALKLFFNPTLVRSIGRDLTRAFPRFEQRAFVEVCLDGLDELELTERAWHITEAMHGFLPERFDKAQPILKRSLGPELRSSVTFGMEPFRYLPHVFYVQRYGLEHFEASMDLQYELTKRFSAESSIRAFLVHSPAKTLARLKKWTQDENVHVRRLVSEGTRPRLPWAPRLRAFQQDPSPVLDLLELLKDDPERYVQRSVANNLNDIAKDHADRVVRVCHDWLTRPNADRRWLVRHALRSLVKQRYPAALELLGAGASPRVRVGSIDFSPRRPRIGDTLRFAFELTSTSREEQRLLVDFAVFFAKSNGLSQPKVFKLKQMDLPGRSSVALKSKVSFAPLTTRRHYPGRHRVELLINGQAYPLLGFTLRE